jgi:hypothetical protein
MVWTELYNGVTGFDWVKSPINDFNLLRVIHLDLVARGSLIGYSSGRTEIAQFNEAGDSFFEPRVIRSEVESQIILWPKFSQFQRGKIGVRNGFGFDPQRIKVEGMSVSIYFDQNQSNVSTLVAKKTIDRRNVVQDIVPANNARKGLLIKNNAKKDALINLDADASATDFVYTLAVGATLQLQPVFLGRISVWFVGSNATAPTATFAGETLAVTEFL